MTDINRVEKPKRRGRLLALILTSLVLLGLTAAPYIQDAQRRKAAPADVKALEQQIGFTPRAARDFYAAHPQIVSSREILQKCAELASGNEQLGGCLTSEGNVYIQRLDIAQIAMEMKVSAAHELLHVEYEGLSDGERKKVDAMLQAEVKKLNDPTLNEQINNGTHGETLNEAHSRIGTEYGNLPADLEKYFRRYFKDRGAIVKAQQEYLAALNSAKSALEEEHRRLDEMRAEADQFRTAGNIRSYNALVDPINELTAHYNHDVDSYNVLTAHTRRPGT